jgi:3-oxoacyl-[acyl-carrier protein] reductase
MGKLDKRVVLVTGAQRGLGSAIVREMAMEGATCIVNYPGPAEEEPANRLVRELEERGASAVAMAADVTRSAEVAAMVQQIVARHGRLDVLVNNAGVNPLKTWNELEFEDMQSTLEVNVSGVFVCCKAVLGVMRDQGKGNIVNIASVAPFLGRGNVDYIASKSALFGLTTSLARQFGPHGIRANAVSPGFHNTEMTQRARQSAENADDFIKAVPLGFLAEADSIGKAALFLASDDSYYITGHNLVVDGGLTLR